MITSITQSNQDKKPIELLNDSWANNKLALDAELVAFADDVSSALAAPVDPILP